ncbi:glycosyltransferase family protein [Phenylobacterium soli]|nr:glycosyltransferase [Phenylobacterium soli]
MALPAKALAGIEGLDVAEGGGLDLSAFPGEPKLIVHQRHMPWEDPDRLAPLRRTIQRGWVHVLEFDDHPDLVAAVNRTRMRPEHWEYLAAFHAIQTSTEPLADLFRRHNPEVAVFPNAAFALPAPERKAARRVFFGALNRTAAGVEAARALGPLAKARADVEFVVVADREVFEALGAANATFSPALDYQAYLDLLRTCEIALSPLGDSAYEACKSDLKFIEAAANGAVTIASPTVYAATIRDGVTGLIARAPEDWPRLLQRLLDDAALRQRLAGAAHDYVRGERLFARQVPERVAWYRSLWDRRLELTEAIGQRVPTMRARFDELRAA